MNAHTPEPWPEAADHPSYFPFATQRDPIRMECNDYERARACVNYCAGLSDDDMKGMTAREVIDISDMAEAAARKMMDQRDALAEALLKLIGQFDNEVYSEYSGTSILNTRLAEADHARAALAKLEGKP